MSGDGGPQGKDKGEADKVEGKVEYVIRGAGKVRHIAGGGGRGITYCNMFYTTVGLRPAEAEDMVKPVCGACENSLDGRIARLNQEVTCSSANERTEA